VNFKATWSDYTDAQRIVVLDRLASLGARWVRVDVGWASAEDSRGTLARWYLDRLDFVVDAAATRGIKVLAMLWSTPAWANGGAGNTKPPDDPAAYARIAGTLARRYKGQIAAWEIWNEPDRPEFFTGSPSDYVALLRAAYPAIKAADPGATVVTGGTEYNDTDYLGALYAAGAHGSFDAVGTHPYMGFADAAPELPDDGSPYTIDHVGAIHQLMAAHGDGALPIWFTELGWSSHANPPGTANWDRGVTEAQQGDYLVRALRFIGARHPYVTNVFWYNEREQATGRPQEDHFGLLTRTLEPKPAYDAARSLLRA
jgi:hypothetical protein